MNILSPDWLKTNHKFIEDVSPSLMVASPWWQAWWFYVLAAGLVFSLFWLVYWTKAQQLDKERTINAKLRTSEERFSKLFHSSPVALAMASVRTGKIIEANSVWCQLVGYSRTEVLGRTVVELGFKSQAARQSLIDDVLATGSVRNREFTFQTRSKQQRTVLGSLELFKLDGEPAVLVTAIDITQRKQIEESLREKDRHLEEAQALAQVGSWVFYPQLQNGVWSKQMFALFGLDPAQGTPPFPEFLERIHPDDRSKVAATNEQVIRTGYSAEVEYRTNPAHGPLRHLAARGHAVYDEQGQLLHAAGTVQDITRRKQAEDAVIASEHKYHTLFERTNNAIFVIDKQTRRFMDANDAAIQLSGRPLAVLRQLTLRDISPDGAEAHLTTTSTHPHPDSGRIIYVRPDGSQRIALLNTVPLDDQTLISIARDITHEVNLEEQFRQAQKLEAIGRLAGGIAHDFNNLLVPIIGYAELSLMTLPSNDNLYANLAYIRKAGERAADLTRQILAFSRQQILELHPLNLNEVIADFQKMAQRLIRENIELFVHLDPALAYIDADKAQIDQILMNLVINAGDAMPTGGKLAIETANILLDKTYFDRYAIEPAPGPYVMLAVSDTGHGMDAETQEHIFEPFFTTKERGQGTGLGLSTIFGIIKQHRGHIWVYSEPGQGTTFKIYLPQSKATPQSLKTSQEDTVPVHGTETVLVVEDEPMVRDLVCETLAAHGYHVLEASSPAHALQLAADYQDTIHLLLTDVIMPHMNGRELHRRVIALRPDIKTLYMSGYTENVIVHHGILDDNIDFLPKPFTITDLTQRVQSVLAL